MQLANIPPRSRPKGTCSSFCLFPLVFLFEHHVLGALVFLESRNFSWEGMKLFQKILEDKVLCNEIYFYIEKHLCEVFLPFDLSEQRCWWAKKAHLPTVVLLWARLFRDVFSYTLSLPKSPNMSSNEDDYYNLTYLCTILYFSCMISRLTCCLEW